LAVAKPYAAYIFDAAANITSFVPHMLPLQQFRPTSALTIPDGYCQSNGTCCPDRASGPDRAKRAGPAGRLLSRHGNVWRRRLPRRYSANFSWQHCANTRTSVANLNPP